MTTKTKNNPYGIQVGQTLLYVSRNGKQSTATIEKIGRVWAYFQRYKVSLDNLEVKDGEFLCGRCHIDAEAYKHQALRVEKWSSLRYDVGNMYKMPAGMTLEKIEQIRALLQEKS